MMKKMFHYVASTIVNLYKIIDEQERHKLSH